MQTMKSLIAYVGLPISSCSILKVSSLYKTKDFVSTLSSLCFTPLPIRLFGMILPWINTQGTIGLTHFYLGKIHDSLGVCNLDKDVDTIIFLKRTKNKQFSTLIGGRKVKQYECSHYALCANAGNTDAMLCIFTTFFKANVTFSAVCFRGKIVIRICHFQICYDEWRFATTFLRDL